jgi:hypothetical protein
MKVKSVLNKLDASDIIEYSADQEIVFAESFVEHLKEIDEKAQKCLTYEFVSQRVEEDDPLQRFIKDSGYDEYSLPSTYYALRSWQAVWEKGETFEIALFVDLVFRDPVDTSGCPDSFLPIQGTQIPVATQLHDRSIIYLWREECPPCETVKENLTSACTPTTPEIGLFAVYGPEWSVYLEEKYDVIGAPTVLFVLNGSIDARLQGAHGQTTIKKELEILNSINEN